MFYIAIRFFDVFNVEHLDFFVAQIMRGSNGGGGGQGDVPPLKNHKNIGFLSNTGPDPKKNKKKLLSQYSMLGYHQHASDAPFK